MKLNKINDVSLTVKDIKIGDEFPIGGSFSALNINLKIDKIPDSLQNAFVKITENATRMNTPALAQWLNSIGAKISPELYAHLTAFVKVISLMFPDLRAGSEKYDERKRLYSPEKSTNLSDVFDKNLFQCAEFATIAQLYLQSVGIDSKYVGGEFISSVEEEFGELHSYNIIQDNDSEYVFDPANNINMANGPMPNIAIIDLMPQQKIELQGKLIKGRKVAFFETKNLLTGKNIYYGYGDGANIFPEQVLRKPIVKNTMNFMPDNQNE